jgi:hypothetical protein
MTREEIALELGRIAQELETRVEIWTDVVDRDGTVSERIYRGTIRRDPRTGERKRQENRS